MDDLVSLLFFGGILFLFIGLLVIMIASIFRNVKGKRIGAYILVSAAVSLLISFTLCSRGYGVLK
jgi:hypothetical protein